MISSPDRPPVARRRASFALIVLIFHSPPVVTFDSPKNPIRFSVMLTSLLSTREISPNVAAMSVSFTS